MSGRQTVRPSPSQALLCLHACIFGAVSATSNVGNAVIMQCEVSREHDLWNSVLELGFRPDGRMESKFFQAQPGVRARIFTNVVLTALLAGGSI
eukprot:765398-Hanusia_phi.AAC.3